MNVALIIPVADLNKYGYANVFPECLGTWAAFADLVILTQTYPDGVMEKYTAQYPNVVCLARDVDPDAPFSWDNMNLDYDHGVEYALNNGVDVAILHFQSNWYIPQSSFSALRYKCENTAEYDWLYCGNQLVGTVFGAAKGYPSIINLRTGKDWSFSRVRIVRKDGPFGDLMERGSFPEFDNEMVIDASMEITLDDLQGKMNNWRCYHDLMPKRKPVFDWTFWKSMFLSKMADWREYSGELDEHGRAIAEASKPEYISHIFLQELAQLPHRLEAVSVTA